MQALVGGRSALVGARPLVAPARAPLVVVAAVPKKKMSKMKTAIRTAHWKAKALAYVPKALFLAKLALKAEGGRESSDKDMSVGTTAEEAPKSDSQ